MMLIGKSHEDICYISVLFVSLYTAVLVKVLQRHRLEVCESVSVCVCVCVCVCREIYFQEMAFMIVGAWQVQNLMGKTSRLDI